MSYSEKESLWLPKLDPAGKEWISWKSRLEIALLTWGLGGYLFDTKPFPITPALSKSAGWKPTTADEIWAVEEFEKHSAEWIKKDAQARHIIVSTLPNTLFMRIRHTKTAEEYFNILKGMFETHSPVIGVELRRQLNELKLKDNGDARTHVNKVIALHEELASLGSPILDLDLFNTFLASLPQVYNNIISSISATTRFYSKTVSVNTLFDMVIDKYDHLMLQDPSKIKTKSENAAFNANTSKKGKGKKKCFNGNCNNCGQFGHWDTDCWDEGGGKEGQAPKGWKLHRKKAKDSNSKDSGQSGKGKQSSAKANTAEAETKEPDGVWFAGLLKAKLFQAMPNLLTVGQFVATVTRKTLPHYPYPTPPSCRMIAQHQMKSQNCMTAVYDSTCCQHVCILLTLPQYLPNLSGQQTIKPLTRLEKGTSTYICLMVISSPVSSSKTSFTHRQWK